MPTTITLEEKPRCSICHGVWHQATGFIVGNPIEFYCCGSCFHNDIVPLIRGKLGQMTRILKRTSEIRRINFYDYVSSRED